MSRFITKLREPVADGFFVILKSDEPGVYLTQNEYLDASGKVEETSVGWSRVGVHQLRHILSLHFELTSEDIDKILDK